MKKGIFLTLLLFLIAQTSAQILEVTSDSQFYRFSASGWGGAGKVNTIFIKVYDDRVEINEKLAASDVDYAAKLKYTRTSNWETKDDGTRQAKFKDEKNKALEIRYNNSLRYIEIEYDNRGVFYIFKWRSIVNRHYKVD